MSLHPSLKTSEKLAKKKSVLKKVDRIKWLINKKLWNESTSVFGLPKIKIVKIKVSKKEKKEEKKEPSQEAKEQTS